MADGHHLKKKKEKRKRVVGINEQGVLRFESNWCNLVVLTGIYMIFKHNTWVLYSENKAFSLGLAAVEIDIPHFQDQRIK
jgi:hypothetical protein